MVLYHPSMSSFTNWRAYLGPRRSALWAGKRPRTLYTAAADFKHDSVLDYDVYTASLFLEHNFPRCEVPTPTASVDIRLVLETIKAEALQRGSWLNIIGYVRKPEQRRKKASSSTSDVTTAAVPLVQAIVIWAAGAIKIADYEATVVGQRALRHEVDFHAAT